MNRETESSSKVESLLLPGRELVRGVPMQIVEQFGTIVDAQGSLENTKTVLLIKHHHGSERDGPSLMRERRVFDTFVSHQDAVFSCLSSLSKRLANDNRLRVAIEALKPSQIPVPSNVAASIAGVQKKRDRFQLSIVDRLHQDICMGGRAAEHARMHLHGGFRFAALETLAGRAATVVPGRPEASHGILDLLSQEVSALVRATGASGFLNEGDAESLVQRANKRYKDDHVQRHAFAHDSLESMAAPDALDVVLFGKDHFRGGKTPAPIEDAFEEYRLFVFEPHNVEVLQMPTEDPNAVWLDPGNINLDILRRAVWESLGRPIPE